MKNYLTELVVKINYFFWREEIDRMVDTIPPLNQPTYYARLLPMYVRAIKHAPKNHKRYALCEAAAAAFYHQEDYANSIKYYEKAREIKKSCRKCLCGLARNAFKLKDYARALAYINQSIRSLRRDYKKSWTTHQTPKISPEEIATVYTCQGDCHGALGNAPAALKAYEMAITKGGAGDERVYRCASKIYREQGDYAKARQYRESAEALLIKNATSRAEVITARIGPAASEP